MKNIRCKIFVYSKTVKTGFYSYGSSVSMKTGEGITLVPKKKGSVTVYKFFSTEYCQCFLEWYRICEEKRKNKNYLYILWKI